jgi:hypothetical protein
MAEVKKNKSLIVVQGINDKVYLMEAIKRSTFNTDAYKEVVEVATERVLDDHMNKFFKWLPFYDRVSDIKYLFSKSLRIDCTHEIYKTVGEMRGLGRDVDVIAHSLGTLMILNSPVEVNNVYLIGSPLSMAGISRLVRWKTKNTYMTCTRLFYVYSPLDPICHFYTPEVKEFLKSYNVIPIVSTSGHSATDYLNQLQVVRQLVESQIDI